MPPLCINPTAGLENMHPRRSVRILRYSKVTDTTSKSMSPRRSNRVAVTASVAARAAAKAATRATARATKNKPDPARIKYLAASAKEFVRANAKAAQNKSTRAPAKKRSMKSIRKPSSKRRKTSPKATVQPSVTSGVIDRESNIQGNILTLDNEPADVMLVLADPAKDIDKFFIIQLISLPHSGADGSYVVYTRWGRTGTVGQALKQDFDELDGAVNFFKTKFQEKTGIAWENRANPATEGTKYRFIQQNFGEKEGGYMSAKWQYWVDDGVDGKTSNWYDYSEAGSAQVERLYHEHTLNGRLTNRLIESGFFAYSVNLVEMTQTNVKHPSRTTRRIRRCLRGTEMES